MEFTMKFSGLLVLFLVANSGTKAAATTVDPTQSSGTTAQSNSTQAAPTGATAEPSTAVMTSRAAVGTTSPGNTTAGNPTAAINATTPMGANTTANATVTTETITTVTAEPSPRFVVNNSDGEPCMLLNFDATMNVKYETTDGGWLESTLPMTNTTSFDGSCASDTLRNFTLYYPSRDTFCAILTLFFNVTSNATYYSRNALGVRYIEPCVQSNAKKYNTIDNGFFPHISYDGTIGKSFKCESILSRSRYFNVTLDNALLQPFAQKSEVKGHFGEVETCKEPGLTTTNPIGTSPNPPTEPSPSNGGTIAGIVIGVLAAVAVVVGVAFYVTRKRRMAKRMAYGHL